MVRTQNLLSVISSTRRIAINYRGELGFVEADCKEGDEEGSGRTVGCEASEQEVTPGSAHDVTLIQLFSLRVPVS